MSKKRVLVLSEWFDPAFKAGGPVRSILGFVESLASELDIWVISTNHELDPTEILKGIIPDVWQKRNGYQVIYISKMNVRTKIAAILAESWDTIYINSLFSIDFALLPLWKIKRGNQKIVLAPRGMLHEGALSIKPIKKKLFLFMARTMKLYSNVIWQASSKEEYERIRLHFPKSQIEILSNLSPQKPVQLNTLVKVEGKPLKLIMVSRIARVKNIKFFIEILNEVKFPYELEIYGSLEEQDYWESCVQLVELNKLKVTYCGILPISELNHKLSQFHLFVSPSLGENFGHSILESLNSSTPVLISDKTPWRQLESRHVGFDLSLENKEIWLDMLQKINGMSNDEYQLWREGAWKMAQKQLDQMDLKGKYLQLFS